MELEALSSSIDRLVGSGPAAWADGESMELLQRELARLEAFVTTAAAAFDASGAWAPDGAQTAAAWLATRCRLPKGQARRLVSRGRRLRQLPACEKAWSAGEITGAHVDTIAAFGGRPPRRPCTGTNRCWSTRPAPSLRVLRPGHRLLGAAGRPRRHRGAGRGGPRPADVYLEAASTAGGWARSPSTLSPGPSSAGSSNASSASCSRPTGPRPAPSSDGTRRSASSAGPRASAGPTPWSRWPPARGPLPRVGVAPPPCSACWWTTRH